MCVLTSFHLLTISAVPYGVSCSRRSLVRSPMALDRSRRLGSVPYGVGLLGPAPHHVRYPVYVAAPRCFPLPLPGLSVPGRGLSCRYPLLATWLRYLLPLSLVLSLRRSPSSPSSLVPLLSTFAVLVLSSLWPAS